MIRLTRSDLAGLARYPLSLQQSAIALWGDLPGESRALSADTPAPADTAGQNGPSRSGTYKK
ncbi:hypothetical protein SLG_10570 [Sphingobium sp. SYK-6]|nr:hypothetical protein SLG_10570 [Sphingobium sp. SYK-6]